MTIFEKQETKKEFLEKNPEFFPDGEIMLPMGKKITVKTQQIDMWDKTETQVTNWPDTKDIPFEFKYFGDKSIRGVNGDCSCTEVQYKDGVVTGKVTHKAVKDTVASIVKKREYNRSHNITVWFTDNSQQILKIKAHVVESPETSAGNQGTN